MNIIYTQKSPNFGPALDKVTLIVMHSTVGTCKSAITKFKSKTGDRVSAHYVIDRIASVPNQNADIYAMVPENMQAWHAGVSAWGGRTYCNHFAISIELANRSGVVDEKTGKVITEPYPEVQIGACVELVVNICARQRIIPGRAIIVSHADIALPKGRKIDPVAFDMDYLRSRVYDLWRQV